jgi:RNA polymerase sigma factor (sigma-70 family)
MEGELMVAATFTHVSLLARIKDEADPNAWREFVRFYGPIVYGFARKWGLQDADAADLMREVMREVARDAETKEYGSEGRTFSGWLFTITRNKISNFLSAQKNRSRRAAISRPWVNSVLASEADTDPDWDTEYQRQLAAKAMDRTKQKFRLSIWQAFWKTAVDRRPAQDVALELKMTPGAVYVARSQVLARLREEVKGLQAEAET